ncbi:hypothetical protein [Phenylobacterium sp.]|jgi:hypothetical protein|uniref:hypothetical protein n=1 Tax=Phenylobacterium sp. TaxID=1871053 RepID=UPI002F3F128E
MKIGQDRAVLTVTRHEGVWVVEHEGSIFGHSPDKEIAKATANKRARQMLDGGRACQVRISGEHGFFAVV